MLECYDTVSSRVKFDAPHICFLAFLLRVTLNNNATLFHSQVQSHTQTVFMPDTSWPMPFDNNSLLGPVCGIDIDRFDNIWIVHRAHQVERIAVTFTSPPPIIAFNKSGHVIRAWRGPSVSGIFDLPDDYHGIHVDESGHVWVGSGTPTLEWYDIHVQFVHDSFVLKFRSSGEVAQQFGKPYRNIGNNDLHNFNRPTKVVVDSSSDQAFIADGYGNQRVVVINATTGSYIKHWGAYGRTPSFNASIFNPHNPSRANFGVVHSIAVSYDGIAYVCDRTFSRIQLFFINGSYITEINIRSRVETTGQGGPWDVALSRDRQQEYMFVATLDQEIQVWQRRSLKLLTRFGQPGQLPGQFIGLHSVTSDSQGNIYTTEVGVGRVQKFRRVVLTDDEVALYLQKQEAINTSQLRREWLLPIFPMRPSLGLIYRKLFDKGLMRNAIPTVNYSRNTKSCLQSFFCPSEASAEIMIGGH